MFLVMAYRYGDLTAYHFPVGVFSNLHDAVKEAQEHRVFRGSKYDHKIFELELGENYDAEESKCVAGTGAFKHC